MKKIAALALLLSLNAFAGDTNVKVHSAQYNANNDSVEVEISYKGGCNDSHSLRLRGCADLFFPYTCQVDVVVKRGEACENDVHGVISFTREELGMKNQKFSRATLIIQDSKKKSNAKIVLPINR